MLRTSITRLFHLTAQSFPGPVHADGGILCDYGWNIELGERVFFNFNCVVLDVCRIRIGCFTQFGPAVQIYTLLHPLNGELRRRQEFGKPVEIGSDVWVGGGAMILPGVRIGSGAVIGAGSVVTRDIPAGACGG
jgi:maltose O-acetyltransferase